MQKLKTRAISYDRFLDILLTINPNIPITIDIGVQPKLNPKIIASIGCSNYIIRTYVNEFPYDYQMLDVIKSNLKHIAKYSIHNI